VPDRLADVQDIRLLWIRLTMLAISTLGSPVPYGDVALDVGLLLAVLLESLDHVDAHRVVMTTWEKARRMGSPEP
jgi:hypothetical protein